MLKPVFITALLLWSGWAYGASSSGVQVTDAWMRATPPGAPTAAGYLTVVNQASQPDRLVSVSSDAADRVELHSSDMQGGVMRMRKLADGLAMPAGASVALSPSGTHLMFIGPHKPMVAGQTVHATLHFAHAAPQVVQFKVLPLGAMPQGAGHDMHAMGM